MSRSDFYKIAIARGLESQDLIPSFAAAFDGGFTHGEVTMNTPGAADLIRRVKDHFGGNYPLGAGTVTDLLTLEVALSAGADFIVSPNFDPRVSSRCKELGVPLFPGALTPTEVFSAWSATAAAVKVFPVGALGGPAYIRDLRGPFNHIPLLACGGVTLENFKDFVAAGAAGIALGGSLFNKAWIENKDWKQIQRYAQGFN